MAPSCPTGQTTRYKRAVAGVAVSWQPHERIRAAAGVGAVPNASPTAYAQQGGGLFFFY